MSESISSGATVGNDAQSRCSQFQGLLVNFASEVGASLIIRGLRAVSDFEYEFQMALMNRNLSPGLETVFMVPSVETTYISSSIIREIAQFGGTLDGLVHPAVAEALKAKFATKRMSAFIEGVRARAAELECTIVFPEAHDERVIEAARLLSRSGIVRPVLLVDSTRPECRGPARDTGAHVIDCDGQSPLELADRLVASGDFDGCVAGASYTTAEVLRAALRIIGVAPGLRTVSSAFYMVATATGKRHLMSSRSPTARSYRIPLRRSCPTSPSPLRRTAAGSSAMSPGWRSSPSAPQAAASGPSVDLVRDAVTLVAVSRTRARRGRRIAR